MLVSVCSLSAQTEKAKSMYEEVVSGKITKEKFIKQEGHIDRAFAIGPPIMMKFSSPTSAINKP